MALPALAACAQNAPQDVLQPEGPIARQLHGLWNITFILAAIVFVLVEGALIFLIFRFRSRSDDESPKQITHNTRLEIAWTLVPFLMLAGLAVPTVKVIFDLAERPPDALEVTVTAKQWWWEYEYPDSGVITANEMHIPTGVPVFLTLLSDDVIHSFWVPKLAGKQDVVPGHTNHLTIIAEEEGEYFGQCAEFCGLSHANMRLRVFAHTPSGFEQWLSDQSSERTPPDTSLAARGEEIFLESQCVACHTVAGTDARGVQGPDLTHFGSRTTFAGAMFETTDEDLSAWIADAPAQKPGAKMPRGIAEMGLSESDIEALVAYLRGLE